MTSKVIIAGLVAMTFVAGFIMTGTMAFGAEKPNGDPFKAIWNAINGLIVTDELLQDQIDNLSTASSDSTSYFSEDYTCEERPEFGLHICTNLCDDGDQSIDARISTGDLTNFAHGYNAVLFSAEYHQFGDNFYFKVLCVDWQE